MPKVRPLAIAELDAASDSDLDRLISLSDGIFAFSMTLLAVNVDLPALTQPGNAAEVTEHVLELIPQFTIYATSFLLVAVYWVIHRRAFRNIQRSDDLLTWLNLAQLLFVAFLPVATGLFDTYSYVPIVVLVYGGTLSAIGLFGWLGWRYATKNHRLVDPQLSPEIIRYNNVRGGLGVVLYVLYIALGIFSPELARYLLLVGLILFLFLPRIYSFVRR